ncbi:MAG: diacylglycerol/lipid kinase family protein [Brevefilum sp.]
MAHKVFVVFNPVAGQRDQVSVKQYLEDSMAERQWHYDFYETTGEGDKKSIQKKILSGNFDLILACGGDGTVSEVADVVAESHLPLGIIPIGTANAFATALGIPKRTEEALDLLFGEHRHQSVDAIQFDDQIFLLEASLGIFSASFEDVDREKKEKLGWLAFVDTVIRNWFSLDPLRVCVDVDGQRFSFRASEIALFNTSQVGIIDEDLDADIRLNDGVLDLYALRSKSLWDVLRALIFRLLGKPKQAPHIRYWEVKESVRISTHTRVSFQADGDVQGETPAAFKVAPGVLKVIVPETFED